MGYIGGALQEQFTERVRGVDPARLLAVPIDVGKHSAAAMVCDFYGEVLTEPLTFPLTEPGVKVASVADQLRQRDVSIIRRMHLGK